MRRCAGMSAPVWGFPLSPDTTYAAVVIPEGFEAALERLQRMILPVWRRPTTLDHWTRVQGVRWERMTLDEKIGQMTQANHRALISETDVADYALGSLLAGGGGSPARG